MTPMNTQNTPATTDTATPVADWQISHTENNGKTQVLFNMASDPDDSGDTVIMVRGRNAEAMAQRLVALLKG